MKMMYQASQNNQNHPDNDASERWGERIASCLGSIITLRELLIGQSRR